MNNSMLEYKGYHASVEFDADDGLFVGEVFGIADSLNFHGESVTELKEMFRQCIDNYLELCKKIGKDPEKEFRGTFNVRIAPELHKKAALEAAKRKMTLNQFVSNAIERYSNKEDCIPSVMYVLPYPKKEMNWGNEKGNISYTNYSKKPILTSKEKFLYAVD